VCLNKEAKAKTVLLDLNPMLGDAALSLGVKAKFSIADAMQNLHRLDGDLLQGLVTEQKPGLAVLASTDGVLALQPEKGSLEKLVGVARETYEYVVVDAGVHAPDVLESLFEAAAGVYLVTQVGVVELRNANRIIQRYFSKRDSAKLQIVLNRYSGRKIEIDEESITKALTRSATWKVPNDYATTRKAQNTGVPIADEHNAISKAVAEMARAVVASEKEAETPKKKKLFGLF
jgi:pilus assembly protein CpaE